ncbi:transglutaminase domain-containing protein [Pinibacter soli]|uniref:Transglutaminase domain-containing protein n=1 Tax=Pinibacter soli TaxID=3044211 RepID=A0ABT6R8I4_9BACT|nr:transglutaminase domain-containing protein [Pinibacter soli]MDI3318227.1 transglutaminase domain-containing protein [Pinibacter soli]
MKKLILTGLILIVSAASFAQLSYPNDVQIVLSKAGKNKTELKKAIEYFSATGDTLKLKAIYFLIANMDIHYSVDYYWANSNEEKVVFNERSYSDFSTALKAFEELRKVHPGLHPVQVKYYDIDTIASSYLINNVEAAFDIWRKTPRQKICFEDFCEYILPYRISVEPLQDWRKVYREKFEWINNDSLASKAGKDKIAVIAKSCYQWFTNTYSIEERKEPLPRLGALQLLTRKKGPCEDIADLNVFMLRSQGMPATIDNIVCWATSSGKHFLNETLDDNKPLSFDVSNTATMFDKLPREPAKVLRTTYSKQASALASFIDTNLIPPGILRKANYVDVTREYWATGDVKLSLFPAASMPKVAYACVLNFLNWTPAWWGNVNNNQVVFTDMCKGAVFLPMSYENKKMKPVGWPIAVNNSNTTLLLKPDTANLRSISVYEQDKYLVFRQGKKYKLFYWNNKWTSIAETTVNAEQKSLVFEKVPRNALLLLVPEYSQKKERPFTISDNGDREWW